jgi:aldose 1-epimerase
MTFERRPLLTCGPLSLVLRPELGGSVARLDFDLGAEGKIPVFRGVASGEGGILDQASFPLVPYVNRIRGGAFRFRGREIRLQPNLEGDAHPLHGRGWVAAWDAESRGDCEAVLRFRHASGEWPWAFYAAQHFVLDPHGLSLSLSCTNADAEPMPCGLGLHPYFPCTPETLLDAEAACAWTIDAATLPVRKVPARGRYGLRRRRICGAGLDNGFGGWSGTARLTDPAWPFALALSSATARFLHVYAPSGGGFAAVEPVTHANGALNAPEAAWESLGLRVLAPGETMELTMRVDVTPVQ